MVNNIWELTEYIIYSIEKNKNHKYSFEYAINDEITIYDKIENKRYSVKCKEVEEMITFSEEYEKMILRKKNEKTSGIIALISDFDDDDLIKIQANIENILEVRKNLNEV